LSLEALEGRALPSLTSLPAYPVGGPNTDTIGIGPTAVLAVDLNGDGKLDLVAPARSARVDAFGNDNTLGVLLGKGNGSFSPARNLAFPGNATLAIAAGDFNGDHKPDIAAVIDEPSGHGYAIVLLLGKGDGTFLAARTINFGTSTEPTSLAVGDFNGDHKLDIAYGFDKRMVDPFGEPFFVPAGVGLLLGKGNGTFTTGHGLSSVTGNPLAADLNGDGKLDLVASGSRGIYSLLGTGKGTFAAPRLVDAGSDLPRAVADLNRDGKLDLIALSADGKKVRVLLGNGAGGFAAPRSFSTGSSYSDTRFPPSLAAGDFNGDHRPDVAVVTSVGVSVLGGRGNGTLGAPRLYPTGVEPVGITAGDFNRDGRDDLAVANFGSQDISVLLADTSGNFRAPPLTVTPRVEPTGLAVADLNGDGKNDLVLTNLGSSVLGVLLGNGDGTFQARTVAVPARQTFAVATRDVNRDGKIDIVAAIDQPTVGPAVAVLLGNGNGTFQTARTFAIDFGPFDLSPSSLKLGDFNGDGKMDIAVSAQQLGGGADAARVFLGNGNGTFQAGRTLAGGDAGPLVPADLNGDGKTDLIAASAQGGVDVFLGSAGGLAATPSHIDLGGTCVALLVGDFNADHKLDLAVGLAGTQVAILPGKGNGTFGNPLWFSVPYGVRSLAAGDFNSDGKTDLAVATTYGGNVAVLYGRGNGTFAAPLYLLGGTDPVAVAGGFFGHNGKADLVVVNKDGDVVVLMNT
jgi:hypothetical protein